jgi:hypothetical protein
MNPTLQVLADISLSHPFSRIGRRDVMRGCVHVPSIEMAVEHCMSESWAALQLQAANRLRREARSRNYDRIIKHNQIVDDLKANSVFRKIIDMVPHVDSKTGNVLRSSCEWDILSICLEVEYGDLVPPLVFVPYLLPVYKAGHFPCGWSGPKLETGWDGSLPEFDLYIY